MALYMLICLPALSPGVSGYLCAETEFVLKTSPILKGIIPAAPSHHRQKKRTACYLHRCGRTGAVFESNGLIQSVGGSLFLLIQVPLQSLAS